MGDPLPPTPRTRVRPLPLLLAGAVGVAAVLLPLLPEADRPFNAAAFGAIGLFVAARAGVPASLGLMLGAKLASDLLLWQQHGYDALYLPFPTVYAGFALYALCGWLLLRRSSSPLRVNGAAVAGGLLFFLATNFVAWAQQVRPYGYTFGGLLDSYAAGLPFYRQGTLVGDLLFTNLLFGLYAALAPAADRAGRPGPDAEGVRS